MKIQCTSMLQFVQNCLVKFAEQQLHSRYRPRFFDQVGHQTTSAYIENKHFFTKSCHRQTYQNYEQPSQRLQNSDFQSPFSASKVKASQS